MRVQSPSDKNQGAGWLACALLSCALAIACGGGSDTQTGTNIGGSVGLITGGGGTGGSGTEGSGTGGSGTGGSGTGGSGTGGSGLGGVTSAGAGGTGTAGTNGASAVSRLALGAQYGCVLDTASAVVCWGMPATNLGETNSPPGMFLSISASARGEVTCGIDIAAQPICWGSVTAAAAGSIPAGLDAVALDVGDSEQCVLNRDGSVACWGVGLPQAPAGPFTQIGVGRDFACALRVDGTVACWGSSTAGANAPVGTYVELQTGFAHSCARTQEGAVICWGLGDSTTDDATAGAWGQAIAPQGVKFKKLALGTATSCGILDSGDVQCWGAGQTTGDCSTVETCGQALPQTGPFTDIAVGDTNACGILETLALKPRDIARGIVRLAIMISLLAIAPLAWSGCLNLGGDSCHGTPDSCHDQICANVLKYGCTEGPGCFGPPCPDCSDTCAQNDQVSCSQQAGCTWDSRPKACTGQKVNESCLGMEKDQCQKLSGCTWGPS